jgi:ribosomal protein S18 acetylase RimI-like enzyme
VPYAIIDKSVFQSGLFDTGNSVVNRAFYQALNHQIALDPDYQAYCLLPAAAMSIIGFFSFSRSADFEISEGYDYVKDYVYTKIDWFGVSVEYQHKQSEQGYGRHLMYHALKQLLSAYPDTQIICLEAKRAAITAYLRYGFIEIPGTDIPGELGGVDMLMPVEIARQYIDSYEKAYVVNRN